jgi:hypothetical protein
MCKDIFNHNRGIISLNLAVILSSIIIIAIMMVAMIIFGKIKIAGETREATIAFYLAETGIEKARHQVRHHNICSSISPICLNPPKNNKCFWFIVTPTPPPPAIPTVCHITAKGSYRDGRRTISMTVPIPPPP